MHFVGLFFVFIIEKARSEKQNSCSFVSNLFGTSEEVQKHAAQLLKWLFQKMETRPAILRTEVG